MINLLNKEGVIKKGLEKYVGKIPGTASINGLQKITLLGIAHILRKVLPKDHGLAPVLQRVNKQVKDYK